MTQAAMMSLEFSNPACTSYDRDPEAKINISYIIKDYTHITTEAEFSLCNA